ncbi:hypothetical protein QJS10_CPA01g00741 [Acorus calamus]|uniref:RNase H type-1 domain-containing protein n=1 Tax=Acorus calamus TaxID=4465 RepID=A0AAV9FKF2_ACOCL|nr:hypothetical protein QJS10_CPA01g00741 [Acorus calamus]
MGWLPILQGELGITKISAVDRLHDRGGYGALLRNDRSDFLCGIAGRYDLPSINLLELKAIEVGIWLAIKTWVQRLLIESDSTIAIAWIKGKGSRPLTAIRSLRLIQHGLLNLTEWKASHIHREGNNPADLLAAFQSTREEEKSNEGEGMQVDLASSFPPLLS